MEVDGLMLSVPVPLLRRGSDSNLNSINDLQQKILKLSEQLRVEQMEQDENVAEFLKLVSMADKQQVARIKQVFEKKHQKTAQGIGQLKKKLEQYHRRMKELDSNGPSKHNSPREPAIDRQDQDVSRDTLKEANGSGRLGKSRTIGPGVTLTPPSFFNKPREFANLIRNKFGSADNIAHLKTSLDESGARTLGGSTTNVDTSKYHSDDESSVVSSADSNGQRFTPELDRNTVSMVLEEFREIQQSRVQLAEDMEALREELSGSRSLSQTLEDERYRVDRLEEQLNDLVELHQHEMANLKQELSSIEERVAYQANERTRDLQEVLESCHSRLCKLEHQVQVVQVESDVVLRHKLLAKAINVLLAVTTALLVCVSLATRCIAPCLRARSYLVVMVFSSVMIALIWQNWETLFTGPEFKPQHRGTGGTV